MYAENIAVIQNWYNKIFVSIKCLPNVSLCNNINLPKLEIILNKPKIQLGKNLWCRGRFVAVGTLGQTLFQVECLKGNLVSCGTERVFVPC